MITREQQIRKAIAILKPIDREREKCRADIIEILDIVDRESTLDQDHTFLLSHAGRLKVRALERALKQVRTAHKALPPTVRELFVDIDYQEDFIVACDIVLKHPPKKKNPAIRQRLAAMTSRQLLRHYGIQDAVTRKKPWHQLAAIFYGDPKADLYPYLRELLEKKPA